MLGPAIYESKGQVSSHVELLLDGVHHGRREGGLIPALLRCDDASLVALVNGTLVEWPLADSYITQLVNDQDTSGLHHS